MNNKKILKVKISTGQGRLHLIDSAKYLKLQGVDIGIITGWMPPKWLPKNIMNMMGSLLGRQNLAFGLSKRIIKEISPENIGTCGTAEFYIQFLFILSKLGIIKREQAAVRGWKFYGSQAKRYIKNDIDILHVRSGAGDGGCIKKAKEMGIKILVDHSIAHPQEVYTQLLKTFTDENNIDIQPDNEFWQLVLSDCKKADALLVNSYYVKDSFIRNGFAADNIFVAELGIRKDFLGLKKNWDIIGDTVNLLFTGGFGLRKGANIILKTMELLIKENISFQLDIVGNVMSDFILPDWCKTSEYIKFHGHVPQDELKNFFINSDIYIFPSYSEGAAQSLKEAMGAGMPVIATYQSGAPIENLKNGLVIKDDSSEDLFKAICMLTDNQNLRSTLGKNAEKTITEFHTWEIYSKNVLNVYETLQDNNKI